MAVGQVEVSNIIKPDFNEPIDILVPAHDHHDLTIRCITAIYEKTVAPFHLVVVDDSTDEITQIYMEWFKTKHNNITYIHSDVPYKCGNEFFNVGLQHGNSEYMAMIMNSITVEIEWEMAALDLIKKNPDWGVVGLKCLFHNTPLIESAGIAMAGYTPIDLGKNLPSHRLNGVYSCDAVQWAFAIVRKKAVIGNLSEDVYNGFKGWDDIDNCFVLRKLGWAIRYCGLGIGYHEPRATRGRGVEDEESHIQNRQNAERFYKRWGYWDEYRKANPYLPIYDKVANPEFENRAKRRRAAKEKVKVEKKTVGSSTNN